MHEWMKEMHMKCDSKEIVTYLCMDEWQMTTYFMKMQ